MLDVVEQGVFAGELEGGEVGFSDAGALERGVLVGCPRDFLLVARL